MAATAEQLSRDFRNPARTTKRSGPLEGGAPSGRMHSRDRWSMVAFVPTGAPSRGFVLSCTLFDSYHRLITLGSMTSALYIKTEAKINFRDQNRLAVLTSQATAGQGLEVSVFVGVPGGVPLDSGVRPVLYLAQLRNASRLRGALSCSL